jgi:magnesium-transporting ATPase (P-type)
MTTVGTDEGLCPPVASALLERNGPNVLPSPERPHPGRRLLAQMTHRFAAMLWEASLLAALAGTVPLSAAIAVVVLINGGFAFWQEYRADRAAGRLRGRCRRDRCPGGLVDAVRKRVRARRPPAGLRPGRPAPAGASGG